MAERLDAICERVIREHVRVMHRFGLYDYYDCEVRFLALLYPSQRGRSGSVHTFKRRAIIFGICETPLDSSFFIPIIMDMNL